MFQVSRHQETDRKWLNNLISVAWRIQASHHVPGTTGNPEGSQPGASTWNEFHWMPEREQQKASGRNESRHPRAQAWGRLQSTLTEDDDIRNLFRAESDFVKQSERKSQDHVRKIDVTNFPIHMATRCIFACDCMWASFQISQIVETYTKRLSEQFLPKHTGYYERSDWESS